MAYMTQEKKKELAQAVRSMIASRYPDVKIRASFSVRNNSAICMTIQACSLDLLAGKQGNWDVNLYSIERAYTGQARDLMQSCVDCLNRGNWNNSDCFTDYYDIGWYVDICIGTWYEPFELLQ